MMQQNSTKLEEASVRSTLAYYVIGFVLSIGLTLFSFLVAPFLGAPAATFIIVAAITQLCVQLYFFLHMSEESRPRWNLQVLIFTALIVSILVLGTLWIMSNLARLHMHTPTERDIYKNGIVAPRNELQ